MNEDPFKRMSRRLRGLPQLLTWSLMPPLGRALLLACVLVACADPEPLVPYDGGRDSGPDVASPDAPIVDAPDAGWGIEALRSEYGLLETIAGAGLLDGVNGWQPSFEGGAAVDAELSRPHIAVGDAAGNVFIADKDAHAIRRVDPSGAITTVAGTNAPGFDGDEPQPAATSRLNAPNGLWSLADGTLYVLDLGNDRVCRVSAGGEMSTLFPIGGAGTGRGLWVADDESLAYVAAGSRLLRWTPSGGVETLSEGFVSLGNLHVAPDGSIGVSDRGGHRVYRVAADGTRTVIAGNGTTDGGGEGELAVETGLDEVRGVWFHPRGGFLLATHKGSQIWFVDPAGVIHLLLDGDNNAHGGDGEPFDTPGEKISEPRAVTMDYAGNILITERDEGHVRRIVRN